MRNEGYQERKWIWMPKYHVEIDANSINYISQAD